MKWKKIGKVEIPFKYFWMNSHAAVPFAEVMEDGKVKIYFTSRDKLNRSRTGYLILNDLIGKKVLRVSKNPVLDIGKLGTFDDSGAMGSSLFNYKNKKYLFYIGWNLGVTVPFRNSIGLAISNNNGKSFEKILGPILDRTAHEPHFVASTCVIKKGRIFLMYYQSNVKWYYRNGKIYHKYHIKIAESDDLIEWKREGKIAIDFKNKSEYAISVPRVIKENGVYKMWYAYRGKLYKIGYAESKDGINWTRKDKDAGIDISKSGWDSEMICYPFILDYKGNRYLLYNGNDYGKTGFGIAILEKD